MNSDRGRDNKRFDLDGGGSIGGRMVVHAINEVHRAIIVVDKLLKCVHDKVQKIVYILAHVGDIEDDRDSLKTALAAMFAHSWTA